MYRRELLKMIAMITGGAVIGGELLSSCRNVESIGGPTFTQQDIAFLNEVADTILPDTAGSKGAKAANIGKFITVMVDDCYGKTDQTIFHEGIKTLNGSAVRKFNRGFMELTPEQRTELLIQIDRASKADREKADNFFNHLTDDQKQTMSLVPQNGMDKDPKAAKMKESFPDYYFIMIKQLTLFGYFTSKEGATKALRYVAVPGKYEPCITYKKGDKAWA
jgi:Gluconate 2-dehydrogenase subunit 3